MNTQQLSQEEKELEKVELLNEFQMEELEQRFEMTAAVESSLEDGGGKGDGGVFLGVSWTF